MNHFGGICKNTQELFIQYGLARHVARAGIAHNQFLYLLDGLDEVAAAVRDNCVTAVNAFKAEHPAEMVICSRSEEYAALKEQLRMGSAVEVQPLTPDQIDLYLNQDGLQLQAVRTTLKTDLDLGELAETPLMLSLMTLAYRGEDKIDLRPRAGKEARRRHIFDQYIARNFERRPLPANSPYTQEQAITWLANLARGMVEHGQSVFHIDLLQTTWLSQSPLNLRCIRFSNNLAAALSLALFIGWIYSFFLGWYIATVVIIVMVLIFGTILPLKRGLNDRVIRPTDQVVWHLPTRELLLEMSSSYKVALVGLLMVSVVAGVGATLEAGLYFGLSIGLLVFLVYSSFGFFFLGQSGGLIDDSSILPRYQMFFSKREITDHQYPNQRIHSSRRNGVKIALMIGILCAPLCYLLFGFVSGLFLSITAGLVLGLGYGGDASIRHYVLRWLLARAGVLPYPFRDSRLIAYLDSMQDRILLRRVGGGWMFVHRSLMEHFARMKEDDQKYATSFPRQSHGNHG